MKPVCRISGAPLVEKFADLGFSPFSNDFLAPEQLEQSQRFYPLCAFVSEDSWLVQVPAFERAEVIFNSRYPYFSSASSSWLEHCEQFVQKVVPRLGLSENSLVVEVASNDGYLLQFFQAGGIPVQGVEPSESVANVAIQRGISTSLSFFDESLANQMVMAGRRADLIVANNVLAHVPDLHGFVEAFRILLKPTGVATFEFPHLLELIKDCQFDTIYHEHFSYLSLLAVEKLFAMHELRVFDVETLRTHGGSLRLYVTYRDNPEQSESLSVQHLRDRERDFGLNRLQTYQGFQRRISAIRDQLLLFLIGARAEGKLVVGYGAPAKANTLLNFCGIKPDLLPWTVDKNQHKQGMFLPGSLIPIYAPTEIFERRPDYVLILPWNLRDEIASELSGIKEWGGRFVVASPSLETFA